MHRRLRAILLIVLPLLTAASLIALPAGARASDPTDPPVVGQCRALTYEQMMGQTDPSQVVPCSSSHTAYTFAVPKFPNGTDLATAPTSALLADATAACDKANKPYFRGSYVQRDMTLWYAAFFIPTTAQLAEGDDWIECDIDAVWPAKEKLLALPAVHKPLYGATQPRAVTVCFTSSYAAAPCTAKHRWRDIGGFKDKRSKYPTRKQFLADGQRCARITKTKKYLVSWPKKQRWNLGDHTVMCAKPTTN